MASSSTLLKLTPLHHWNPTISYTHHRSAHYRFFCKPNNLIRLQISCEHKQRNTDAKSDSLPALFPDCDLAVSGGRIVGSAFLSPPSSSSSSSSSSFSFSSYSFFSSSSSSWWSSFLSLKVYFSSGWMVAIFLALSVVFVVSVLIFWVLSVVIKFLKDRYVDIRSNQKISVVKLQVGLLGSGRTIQQDFDRLAENADTSTKEGLGNVLTEATLDLLRHPEYCISCYSSVDVKQSEEEGEDWFNRLSIDERRKFEVPLVNNVNSIKRKSSKIQRASGFSNEYIVVTILVHGCKGYYTETATNKRNCGSRGSFTDTRVDTDKSNNGKRIMAVEILWTPKDKKESLSERKLLKDYPALKPF